MRRAGEGGLGIAITEPPFAREVAAQAGMQHRRLRRQRGQRIDHRRHDLVTNLDQVERVFGDVTIGGHDERDRLAHIAHAVGGDRPAVDRRLHADDEAAGQRLHLVPGEHGRDTGQRRGARGVDRGDAGMGVRRAQDRGMQRAWRHGRVVEETAASGEQRGVLDPRQRLSNPRRVGHPS